MLVSLLADITCPSFHSPLLVYLLVDALCPSYHGPLLVPSG